MIVRINGTPIEEVIKDAFGIASTGVKEAYGFIHTPINVEISSNAHHLLNIDANVFNIPHHAFHLVKPHIVTAFDYLF